MFKRKYIITFCLPLTLLAVTGCESILDKEPTDRLSVEETFKDLDGVKTALAGAYGSLMEIETYNARLMLYPDVAAGNSHYINRQTDFLYEEYNFSQSAQEGTMQESYVSLYSTLNNVNNIIRYTPTTLYATEKNKNRVLGEASTLRALIHFELVRLYARPYAHTADASHPGIVLSLKNRSYADPLPERATVAETYAAIEEDLLNAIAFFGNSNAVFKGSSQYYFNASSAKALLAKVYLYKGDWNKAYTYANEVISSNQYQLLPNSTYAASWDAKNPSSESVFELAIGPEFSGTSLGSYYDVLDSRLTFAATNDLLSLYSETDVRGVKSLFNSKDINGTPHYFTRKYGKGGVNATNVKLLRLSEMYLIRAEAAAELNNLTQANQDLNLIRLRADTAAAELEITDKPALLDAILLERRKELAFEGNLHFDLMRRKQGISRTDCRAQVCSLPYEDDRLVLPLPKSTTDVNPKLKQNPGY
ncbi:RagB/SusD family nutrient uptake outer membrane protein [Pontibacter sp. Tf4]|uniref:RagB/SusD family nutrient uptake outer membrane protein n=1 Tax=Pontibacter sp. Tf4 TaxID=2761620 RepID=UPI001623F7C3|nr:RagB/SusD family nutrient uptake outer membrane protein [Pontibacter sp. Tf4]MBB6612645.1 RagB/SusD family nutrient uptake outer membrane protein [Pontibacter sp. Tf4]